MSKQTLGEKLSENLKAFGLKQVLAYIEKDPEKNVPKILDWLIKTDKNNVVAHQAKAIHLQGKTSEATTMLKQWLANRRFSF